MKTNRWLVALAAVAGLAVAVTPATAQRPWGGGRPSFERLLDAFDDNDDGELTEDEVPPPVWSRLKAADKNNDGAVTKEEFDATRGGGRRG